MNVIKIDTKTIETETKIKFIKIECLKIKMKSCIKTKIELN